MIFRTKHLVSTLLYLIQGPKFWGGDPPSQSSTVTQATIPEELKPFVSTYMNAAEKQLYQKNDAGEVTGFQPYKAYGATFDEAGKQTGYDPSKGIAGFDPMQTQAYNAAQGLSTGNTFNTASNMAGSSGAGSLAAGQNFQNQLTDPNSVNAYMSPYLQNVMNQQIGAANRTYDISGAAQQGEATRAGAFGGSREALMASENERNRNTAIGGIQATGYQNAFTNAQAQQKAVADLGLQGMSQAGQAAGTLGNIGGQDLAAQTSILKTQADAGALARSREQTIKDQAVLDYQNAQNKPITDISTMSNLVRGIPTGSNAATTYAPAPSALSQIGGLAATGIGAYGALKANGGVIEDKGYANGGIVGHAGGGSVENSMRGKLQDLDASHLQSIIRENESPELTKLAKEVLATNYAKGGIVAFADRGIVNSKTAEQMRAEDLAKQLRYNDQYPIDSKTAEQMRAEDKVAAGKKEIKRGGLPASKERMAYEAEVAARDAAPVTESAPSSSSDPWAERSNIDVRGNVKKGLAKVGSGIASLATPGNIAVAGSELNAQRFKEGLGSESTLSSVEHGVLGGLSLAPEITKHLIEKGTGGSIGEQLRKSSPDLAKALDEFGDSVSKRYEIIKKWATTPVGGNKGIAAVETPAAQQQAPAVVETPKPTGEGAAITPAQASQVGPLGTKDSLKNDAINQAAGTTIPRQDRAGIVGSILPETAPVGDTTLAGMIKARDAAQADANISVEDRVKSQKEMEERLVGKDEDTAAYRKSIMDERANAPDEARRQMYMRLMEFGANWGSTPGAPLAAGLKAITSVIPGIMTDTKENKKMMKDLDKSEYLLNHAARLEELGRFKDATKAKADASELFLKHDEKVVAYGLKQQEMQSAERIAKQAQFGATMRSRIETEGRADPRAVTGTGRLASIDRELATFATNKRTSTNPDKYQYTPEEILKIKNLEREREILRGDTPQYQAPAPNDPERVRGIGDNDKQFSKEAMKAPYPPIRG